MNQKQKTVAGASCPRPFRGILAPSFATGTLILSLFLTGLTQANTTWFLSKTTAQPGDVIQLTAKMTEQKFSELKISLPEIKNLHLVNHHQTPVQYSSGTYTQQSTWTFQPTAPGTILIPETPASTGHSETTLPTLTLTVEKLSVTADSFTPEPLPELKTAITKTLSYWLIPIAALFGFLTIFLLLKSRKKAPTPTTIETPPTLADLKSTLQSGGDPQQIITSLLNDHTLSPTLRTALEKSAYAKTTDHTHLLETLTREEAP